MRSSIVVVILVLFSTALYAQENAIANAINENLESVSNIQEPIKKEGATLLQGWVIGLNFGVTKFQGDIAQYDHYPAYQEEGDYSELKTAISIKIEKKINSLYSLSAELTTGQFGGLRRSNEYLGMDVFDVYNNYEGNGDKFTASFNEIDLLVNVDLTNAMTYFGDLIRNKKISFTGKLGMGYSVFNTVRRNLFTDTYIYSYGYSDEGPNTLGLDYGNQSKSFVNQAKSTVYIYGITLSYKLNPKINLYLDYTLRNGMTDKWDASMMNTQYTTDKFAFVSIGASYNIGDHNYNNDWTSPIDVLEDDVSTLNARIEGFTDDIDNDGVADSFDKDPNTPLGVSVDGSGNALDVDMDNVPDYRDADPFSNRGALVDENGVELDDDKDGVPNSKDLENNTPEGTIVNQFGMNIGSSSIGRGIIYFPSIYFNSGSAVVEASNKNRMATMALLLKHNEYIKLDVIGHTDNVGTVKFNKELGLKRANAVINYLVLNYNIGPDRFTAKTRGEEEPLSDVKIINKIEGASFEKPLSDINRRVDFEIVY